MYTSWNRLCILGLAGVAAVMLMACASAKNGKDGILPFTPIVPGMSIEEILKLEPELTEGADGYYLTKDYNGFPMEAYILPEKLDSVISWCCDDEEQDLDKLADSLTDYFNRKYEVHMTMDEDEYHAIVWQAEKYNITLMDSDYEIMGIESRDVTLYLAVRLDVK